MVYKRPPSPTTEIRLCLDERGSGASGASTWVFGPGVLGASGVSGASGVLVSLVLWCPWWTPKHQGHSDVKDN